MTTTAVSMASKGCRVEWLEKTENEDSDSWLRESAYRLGMSWQVKKEEMFNMQQLTCEG